MKHNWIILLIGCTLIACNKKDIDFGFSPTNPRAGESIQFTNLSTSGEEWDWSFGDATTSAVKNPTKIYKLAGTSPISRAPSKTLTASVLTSTKMSLSPHSCITPITTKSIINGTSVPTACTPCFPRHPTNRLSNSILSNRRRTPKSFTSLSL